MDDLEWYHGNISRHIAEALLMSNGREGSFLMREVPGAHCLSVRCRDSVKHLKIEPITGGGVTFAHSEFDDVDQLLQVFANHVVLCSEVGSLSKNFEQGTLITLKHPYPKQVEEPDNYDDKLMLHSTMRVNATLDDLQQQTKAIPLASKSGFLTKRGGSYKSWKLRWFVVVRNELSYYESRSSERAIKTIDLEACSKLSLCDVPGKSHCFYLQLPDRTWYFSAASAEDLEEWTAIIDWKMKRNIK